MEPEINNERKISPHYVVVKVALYDDLINWDEVEEVDWLIECIKDSELSDFRMMGVGDTIGKVIELYHIGQEPDKEEPEKKFYAAIDRVGKYLDEIDAPQQVLDDFQHTIKGHIITLNCIIERIKEEPEKECGHKNMNQIAE